MVKKTHSIKETIELGRKLGKTLMGGEVVLLQGELGSGKTTLVKGLAHGLGVTEDITSPTFLMLRPYQGVNQLKLIHVDGYRLGGADEVRSIGLEEYLGRHDTIVVIEWPERLKPVSRLMFKGLKVKKLRFHIINETTRQIDIAD